MEPNVLNLIIEQHELVHHNEPQLYIERRLTVNGFDIEKEIHKQQLDSGGVKYSQYEHDTLPGQAMKRIYKARMEFMAQRGNAPTHILVDRDLLELVARFESSRVRIPVPSTFEEIMGMKVMEVNKQGYIAAAITHEG